MLGHPLAATPIVVVAFNRPASLRRLLGSLANLREVDSAPLIVSIDGGGSDEVARVVEAFDWPHGPKTIRRHEQNLGLKAHVLSCADVALEHGSVIVLEDDLFASPFAYAYARLALAYYATDDRVAGVALYGHEYNETARVPFRPVDDGGDAFFLQVPASSGEAWTAQQWSRFRAWLAATPAQDELDVRLPRNMRIWRASSWKKDFARYLIATGRTVVYPRAALTTNFGEAGTHYGYTTSVFQSALQSFARDWRLIPLEAARARYDMHCEIDRDVVRSTNTALAPYDFDVDLHGSKDAKTLTAAYVVTVRRGRTPLASFGRELKPIDNNLLFGVPGHDFGLYRQDDVADRTGPGLAALYREHVYFFSEPSPWRQVLLLLATMKLKLPTLIKRVVRWTERANPFRDSAPPP